MSETHRDISFGFKLFQGMQRDNLGYIYRGLFTQNITDSIISLTETNFDAINESSKVKKRVFSIMVECLQNITRHQTEFNELKVEESDTNGIFVIQNKDNSYYITTGNVVNDSAIPKLTEQLNTINSLEKDDLKAYYKKILEDGTVSNKGGAGLGLIEMARKSGNKLNFAFKKINSELSYFYLHTSISKDLEENPIEIDLENIKELHELINREDILLIFNGVLNQESLINLLSIIEGQMIGSVDLKKKVFNVMVEMLQNIVKHATKMDDDTSKGNPGIFFMSETNGSYTLNTGNYIRNQIAEELSEKIDHVNNLEGDELDLFYSKRLLNFEIDNSKEAGLGIIDLRLKSGNKLEYNISRVNDILSFFTLQIRL